MLSKAKKRWWLTLTNIYHRENRKQIPKDKIDVVSRVKQKKKSKSQKERKEPDKKVGTYY